jgi:hypothetical protein
MAIVLLEKFLNNDKILDLLKLLFLINDDYKYLFLNTINQLNIFNDKNYY